MLEGRMGVASEVSSIQKRKMLLLSGSRTVLPTYIQTRLCRTFRVNRHAIALGQCQMLQTPLWEGSPAVYPLRAPASSCLSRLSIWAELGGKKAAHERVRSWAKGDDEPPLLLPGHLAQAGEEGRAKEFWTDQQR